MTDPIYQRPLTPHAALQRLQHPGVQADLAMIAARIDRISETQDDYAYGTIQGPLYEALQVCRRTFHDASDAVVAVACLQDRPIALIGRFADRLAWFVFPLRRLTHDGDPHGFLARLALSPEMLTRTLMCPRIAEIHRCRDILTDPTLSALQIADALMATDPKAAAKINAWAFSGTPLDLGARRFYRTTPQASLATQVGDARTGLIVHRGDLDDAAADAMVAGLETDTVLADRFVDCVKRITRQQWRVRMSRRTLPFDAPRTAEADVLDALYVEREGLIRLAMGETAYLDNQARLAAEHEAWLSGLHTR